MELAVLIAGKLMLLLLAAGLLLIPITILLLVGAMIDKLSQWLFERDVDHILKMSKSQAAPAEGGEAQVMKEAGKLVGGATE